MPATRLLGYTGRQGAAIRFAQPLFDSGRCHQGGAVSRHAGSGPDSQFGQVLHFAAGGTTDLLGDLAATGCVRVEHWWAIRGRPSIAPFGERDDDGREFAALVGEMV